MAKITLSHLVKKTGKVTIGEDHLEVKGLTLLNLAHLSREYASTLGKLVDKEATDIDWKGILLETPDFCHTVIAMTTEGLDAVDDAKLVPVGIQIKILIEAWNLSSIDPSMIETAVKKLLGLLSSLKNDLGLTN
ncbi:hypothetical protein VH22019_00091 [Vibrio phage VH2_2019]|nr:hypothetical protein VH22019_00091 [Vibrio phage VH2_2019]